jgi:plastocyanin
MTRNAIRGFLFCGLLAAASYGFAQDHPQGQSTTQLRLRVVSAAAGRHHTAPAVVWLKPLAGTPSLPFASQGHYALLQTNRTFIPHLQVVPVGSVVSFPNADPFFHNVFSLFEGKRFDLGLYEAGSSRSVTFSREGVSYIFCNIHPEMSAVVLALSTPLNAIAASDGSVTLQGIPLGDYRMHIWIEGVPPASLESLSRTLHLSSEPLDLGTVNAPLGRPEERHHSNKFGAPYDTHTPSPY